MIAYINTVTYRYVVIGYVHSGICELVSLSIK